MMNLKLVNVFAVSLITFAVIFPSLTVFGWVWEKHVEFVETQQSISTYNQTTDSECSALLLQANSLTNNNFSDLYLNSNSNEINRNLSDNYQTRHLWRWFFLLIPFCIGTAIYCYDRYLVYRANIFQQQVEMLEKVWQQSLEK